jgi:hypothetical protein
MACQSLDNTIRVFSTRDRFKEMRKKIFRGTHTQRKSSPERLTHKYVPQAHCPAPAVYPTGLLCHLMT